MISLRHGAREFLWHDPALIDDDLRRRVPVVRPRSGGPMSTWQNWGGDKSWPAPQARDAQGPGWRGPPDPVLDGGPYRVVRRDRDRGVVLESEVDERTGLQQTRSIVVGARGVVVGTTVANRSSAPVRCAPWEVMQVAVTPADEAEGVVEVEREADGPVLDLGRYRGVPRVAEHGDRVRVRPGHAVAKLGFPGATDRVGCRFADGARLDLRFAASRDAPEGAPFQLWMQTPVEEAPAGLGGWRPAHRLVELEPLGALVDLAPGGSCSLVAAWIVRAPRSAAGPRAEGGGEPDR